MRLVCGNPFHFCPYSGEIAKLSHIYNKNSDNSSSSNENCYNQSGKKSKSNFKVGHFSLLQALLISYALVAILRFFTIAYLQFSRQSQLLEAYYRQVDLLMSMVNFRRNLNEYVHLCFAAFAGFTVYTHYLNYYRLNWTVVGLLQGNLKAKRESLKCSDLTSSSTSSSKEKKVNGSSSPTYATSFGKKSKFARKSAKSSSSFTESFVRAESSVFLVLYLLFSE